MGGSCRAASFLARDARRSSTKDVAPTKRRAPRIACLFVLRSRLVAFVLYAWPYAGVVAAVVLIGYLAIGKRRQGAPPRWRDPQWVLAFLWPMYLLHQFEEHGVDALGRRYAFLGDLCRNLGYEGGTCPADPAFIFAVNVVGCQIAFAISWFSRRRRPLVAACAWGIPIVNAVAHIGGAVVHRAYNPGLVTSVVLFIPLSAWMLATVLRSRAIAPGDVIRIVALGIVVHVVLMASLLFRARGWLGHDQLLLVNALNGLWPLAFGTFAIRSAVARV